MPLLGQTVRVKTLILPYWEGGGEEDEEKHLSKFNMWLRGSDEMLC